MLDSKSYYLVVRCFVAPYLDIFPKNQTGLAFYNELVLL